MAAIPSTSATLRYYFVDEVEDGVLFNQKGRSL